MTLVRLWQTGLRGLAEMLDQTSQLLDQENEARFSVEAAFVHVERPIDLDLQRMAMRPRPSVKLRRETAGIGRVDGDLETASDEKSVGGFENAGGARCA